MGEVEPVTDILLQNVGVLAIDQSPNEKKTDPILAKTATLTVDQQGAQKLALAGQVGTLSLALRNAANQDEFISQTVGTRDLGQGNSGASLYAGAAQRNIASAANANPYPYPTQPMATVRRGTMAAARPRPANSVGVEIVRGTASTSYDVTRQGGF
jgi:pilus assembly protein CpaB